MKTTKVSRELRAGIKRFDEGETPFEILTLDAFVALFASSKMLFPNDSVHTDTEVAMWAVSWTVAFEEVGA